MARDFRGIPFSTLPEPDAVDFTFRLRNMLSELDQWARDQSFAMGRIERGQVPNGSGDPLPGGDGLELPDDVGAVLFIDSGPSLGSDGSVFFWDTANSVLGIGTNTPAANLGVESQGVSSFARPISLQSGAGPWLNSAGDQVAMWTYLDETVADDSDYIRDQNSVGAAIRFNMTSLSAPIAGSTHTLRIRPRVDDVGGPSTFEWTFFSAGNVVKTVTGITLSGSFATLEYVLSAGEIALITDYTDLDIQWSSAGAGGDQYLVSWVEFQITSSDADLIRWDLFGGTQSGRIEPTGHVGIGTGSDSIPSMLTVESDAASTVGELIKGATSQSGNLLEFRNQADTLLSRVKSDGTWDGPVSTTSAIAVTDNVFSILDNATPSKVAQFQCSGISSSTTRTFTFPDVSGILPTLGNPHTVAGAWVFDFNTNAVYCPKILVNQGFLVNGSGFALDDGTGFFGEIGTNTLTGDRAWAFPDASGIVVVDNTATQYTLTLGTASELISSTNLVGGSFQDTTTNTKRLRFVLSGSVGANFITIANTAARGYTLGDVSSGVTQLGIAASAAGTLGRSVLTGQNASIGATTLLTSTTVTAGLYRVSFYLKTTTAGDGGDTVLVTVAWNDGTAQTFVSGNLDAGAINAYLQFNCVVRAAASTAITYTTTLTSPGAGTPVHTLDARLEFLG